MGLNDQDLILQNVEHFTSKEGPRRDQIVENYFGIEGMKILIKELIHSMDGNGNYSLLDLGVGTGTFLIPVLDALPFNEVAGFDATPKMLELLDHKLSKVSAHRKTHLVIGDMQQITKSIHLNNTLRQLTIPHKFDRIMSTLAFHHVPDTAKVLQGISKILKKDGKAVIVDGILSDTSGMNPTLEHAHNGFRINELEELAGEFFSKVTIRELNVTCNDAECSSQGTGLFLMELSNPR